jgi:hypothetical protein
MIRMFPQVEMDFSAPAPLERADHVRLGRQRAAVFAFMADGEWHTLREIAEATGHPEASVSARLRDFRRERHGGHSVLRRRVPDGNGLHAYQLVVRR